MAATRADVARAAGVSPSTVTYVLSGQRSTRSSTRERVMRAVRELDYHPNIAARSLASPGLRTAGVLFRRQRSTIDANDLDYVDGVRRALEPSGIQVVIPVMTSSAPLIELRSLVRSGSLGGVVLMDVAQGDEREAMLLDEEIPTVLIGSSGRAVGAPGVDTDFVQMAHASVEHLAGLGHRRIIGQRNVIKHRRIIERRRVLAFWRLGHGLGDCLSARGEGGDALLFGQVDEMSAEERNGILQTTSLFGRKLVLVDLQRLRRKPSRLDLVERRQRRLFLRRRRRRGRR